MALDVAEDVLGAAQDGSVKVFIFMRRNPRAAENGAEDVLGFLNTAMKDLATHACPHACPLGGT